LVGPKGIRFEASSSPRFAIGGSEADVIMM
jgi:hypothetical protein